MSSESNLDTYANVDVTWSYLGAVDSCGIVNQQISFQQLDVMGCEQSSADPIMIELGAETRQYEATYLDAFSLYNVTLTVETRTGHYHKSLQVRTDSTSKYTSMIQELNSYYTTVNTMKRWLKGLLQRSTCCLIN